MSERKKIKAFWKWFESNNHKYLFLNQVSEEEGENLMNDLLNNLHNYSDELYFEIGGHPQDKKVELVITAQGVAKNFEKVEQLIDLAPKLDDWDFVKFKQASGRGVVTNYEGIKFDPDKIICIPLENKEDPSLIGFNVCYPDLLTENYTQYLNATFIMIDTLLGEKSAALDIDYLEVISTPDNISDYNFIHASDTGEYIRRKKNQYGRYS